MTVDIRIGNAVVDYAGALEWLTEDDFDMARLEVTVSHEESANAPDLLNDSVTGNTNHRSMSNHAYRDFIKDHNLSDWVRLMPEIAMVYPVTQTHLDIIKRALDAHRARIGDKVPGWALESDLIYDADLGRYRLATEAEWDEAIERTNTDADLARLMWLHWWLSWALDNCECPAIRIY